MGLAEQLVSLAASAGNEVVGIAVCFVHDTKGVGAGSGYATKGLGSFRRRRHTLDVDAGQQRSRTVAIDDGLRGPEYVVLDGELLRGKNVVYLGVRYPAHQLGFNCQADDLVWTLCGK